MNLESYTLIDVNVRSSNKVKKKKDSKKRNQKKKKNQNQIPRTLDDFKSHMCRRGSKVSCGLTSIKVKVIFVASVDYNTQNENSDTIAVNQPDSIQTISFSS